MANTHYIAMSGSYGCLPDYCQAYEHLQEAVDSLQSLFDLEGSRLDALYTSNYTDLGTAYGADYCEIVDCDCATPEDHNDC